MKQNTIVFFCVGTGGHVLPVINLIDDLRQRGIEKRKIEVVTDKRGSQYFKDRDIDVHSIDIYRSKTCLLYTSPSPRDQRGSRMPSSA